MNRPEQFDALPATAVKDFYRALFAPRNSDQHYLKVSRVMPAIWGGVQIAVARIAIAMQGRGVDAVLAVASFTNAPVLGLFLLSALTRHVGESHPARIFAGLRPQFLAG